MFSRSNIALFDRTENYFNLHGENGDAQKFDAIFDEFVKIGPNPKKNFSPRG